MTITSVSFTTLYDNTRDFKARVSYSGRKPALPDSGGATVKHLRGASSKSSSIGTISLTGANTPLHSFPPSSSPTPAYCSSSSETAVDLPSKLQNSISFPSYHHEDNPSSSLSPPPLPRNSRPTYSPPQSHPSAHAFPSKKRSATTLEDAHIISNNNNAHLPRIPQAQVYTPYKRARRCESPTPPPPPPPYHPHLQHPRGHPTAPTHLHIHPHPHLNPHPHPHSQHCCCSPLKPFKRPHHSASSSRARRVSSAEHKLQASIYRSLALFLARKSLKGKEREKKQLEREREREYRIRTAAATQEGAGSMSMFKDVDFFEEDDEEEEMNVLDDVTMMDLADFMMVDDEDGGAGDSMTSMEIDPAVELHAQDRLLAMRLRTRLLHQGVRVDLVDMDFEALAEKEMIDAHNAQFSVSGGPCYIDNNTPSPTPSPSYQLASFPTTTTPAGDVIHDALEYNFKNNLLNYPHPISNIRSSLSLSPPPTPTPYFLHSPPKPKQQPTIPTPSQALAALLMRKRPSGGGGGGGGLPVRGCIVFGTAGGGGGGTKPKRASPLGRFVSWGPGDEDGDSE